MPIYIQLLSAFLIAISSCTNAENHIETKAGDKIATLIPETIRGISLPQGFNYVTDGDSAYSNWLLNLELRKNKTVYLYNGKLKSNQDAQYGVLNIAIGKKDLLQCADAAMKLKADYLFEKNLYDQIRFITTSGNEVSFDDWLKGVRWKANSGKLVPYNVNKEATNIHREYDRFMELVFSYCGTYSLSKQLKPVDDATSIQPGDIFVYGGFPGHAVTVMAVATNKEDKRIFLLSQGYMPAQDLHILKNYANADQNPWYKVSDLYPLHTPQWQFEKRSLKRW